MLQGTGKIGSGDIVREMDKPTSMMKLNKRYNAATGMIEVLIDDVWTPCNPCSQNLPQTNPPHRYTDFYNYNHHAGSVSSITISGDDAVDSGQSVTYTATLSGDNTTGAIITWYKFDNGSWSASLGTGTSKTITWVKPINGLVRVVVTGLCNGEVKETTIPITWNCTPPSSAGYIYQASANEYKNAQLTYYLLDADGSNTNRVVTWEATNGTTIITHTDTSVTVLFSNLGLTRIRAIITNYCGSHQTDIFVTVINNPNPTVGNTAWSGTKTKNDCTTGNGTAVSLSIGANVFYGMDLAEANAARDAWLQQQANAQGQCTTEFQSDPFSGQIQKNDCTTGTGSWVSLNASAGQFTSTVSVADANTQRDAWLQAQANAQGTCGSDPTPTCDINFSISIYWLDANTPVLKTKFNGNTPAGSFNLSSSQINIINPNYSYTLNEEKETLIAFQGGTNASNMGTTVAVTFSSAVNPGCSFTASCVVPIIAVGCTPPMSFNNAYIAGAISYSGGSVSQTIINNNSLTLKVRHEVESFIVTRTIGANAQQTVSFPNFVSVGKKVLHTVYLEGHDSCADSFELTVIS